MTFPTPPGRRPVFIAMASLIGAMTAGVLAGIAIDRTVLLPATAMFPRVPMIPGEEPNPEMRKKFVGVLARELKLSEAQRVQVEAVMEQQVPNVRAAADSARAIFERAMAEPRAAMMQILNPEQQEKFFELTGFTKGVSP